MSKSNTLFMETTSKSPESTAGEIVALLVSSGATQVNMAYEGGRITGLRWCFRINGIEVLFDMPVRIDPIRQLLRKRGRLPFSDQQKPDRVAWRQLFRWVESQVALIETGMVSQAEPFLAYMFNAERSQTLFQSMMETQFKALPAPEKPQ